MATGHDALAGTEALWPNQVVAWYERDFEVPADWTAEAEAVQVTFGACGYEDQDDADTLRTDPLLKLVCRRLPETGHALASQPTLSRLENAVDRRACYRLAVALDQRYLCERERDGSPPHIVLDLDGTDDPTHGAQEGSAYHGYYRQHMLHPLLVFDGTTGQLITAVLRPGNTTAAQAWRRC